MTCATGPPSQGCLIMQVSLLHPTPPLSSTLHEPFFPVPLPPSFFSFLSVTPLVPCLPYLLPFPTFFTCFTNNYFSSPHYFHLLYLLCTPPNPAALLRHFSMIRSFYLCTHVPLTFIYIYIFYDWTKLLNSTAITTRV